MVAGVEKAAAGEQPAQAGLGFDAGQFLRAGAARHPRRCPGQLHHQLSPAGRAGRAASGLVRQFPNLTLIDVGAILGQLQSVIGQVAGAVQFVFLFSLLAGGIVLYSALLTAFDERRYELAVMRALGAQRATAAPGAAGRTGGHRRLAGLIAALGAMALGTVVGRQVFDLELALRPWLPLLSALGGAALAIAVGWLAIRRLVVVPPLLALRNGV
jgi:putative ABC transport system permease protein